MIGKVLPPLLPVLCLIILEPPLRIAIADQRKFLYRQVSVQTKLPGRVDFSSYFLFCLFKRKFIRSGELSRKTEDCHTSVSAACHYKYEVYRGPVQLPA